MYPDTAENINIYNKGWNDCLEDQSREVRMRTKFKMECFMAKEETFKFSVTEHKDRTISIHGFELDANFNCSIEQAKGLVTELQEAIARLEMTG